MDNQDGDGPEHDGLAENVRWPGADSPGPARDDVGPGQQPAEPGAGLAGRGLARGAWGAAQATGAGLSTFIGGATRDLVNHAAGTGVLGEALATPATGYSVVYHAEIGLLFATLIALGPLGRGRPVGQGQTARLGLADFPT